MRAQWVPQRLDQKGYFGGFWKELKFGQAYHSGQGLCNLCSDPKSEEVHFLKQDETRLCLLHCVYPLLFSESHSKVPPASAPPIPHRSERMK